MTLGHRYELHRSGARDAEGHRLRWCVYDYFDVCRQKGLSFWYFATKREALSHYPEADLTYA